MEKTKAKAAKAAAKLAAPAKKLPVALAEHAEQQASAKKARLASTAKADIALVRRRQAQITESFYDIGEALVRLKRPEIVKAAGRATFRELCERDLEMSLATADRLVAIVTHVAREDALRMGQQRALALAQLANATPEADSAAQLETKTRKLPSGKRLDLSKASTREIEAATRELRATKPAAKPARGRTTTPQEKETAAALQAALRKNGLERSRVVAVATKPGQPADLRIDRVPVTELAALRRALGK